MALHRPPVVAGLAPGVAPGLVGVDRSFVRADGRLLHFRSAGDGAGDSADAGMPPIVLAHGGPGSSAGLVPMIEQLAATRCVFAPDTPGCGDSEPLPLEAPTIADYADALARFLDRIGLSRVDFYGQHTGAQIGCELALRHPLRVRRLALDGLLLIDDATRQLFVERYAPAVRPDDHGGHLMWAWNFVRELSLHFPHFLRDPGHRLHESAVPPAQVLQSMVMDLMKALPTYHLAYRAAFSHALAARLRLLSHPSLIVACEGDPLERYAPAAHHLVPGASLVRTTRQGRATALQRFFQAADEPGPSAPASR